MKCTCKCPLSEQKVQPPVNVSEVLVRTVHYIFNADSDSPRPRRRRTAGTSCRRPACARRAARVREACEQRWRVAWCTWHQEVVQTVMQCHVMLV